MKRVVILVIVLGLTIGGVALTRSSKTEYVAPEVQIKEKEVQVDALEKAVKDAQDAKQTDMKATAQKAYDEAYNQEMKKVELEVVKSFSEKLDVRQVELKKETGEY